MRIVHLPVFWTILIDVLVWLGIHMGLSYLIVQLPADNFDERRWLYRKRKWELKGKIYEELFLVKKWKGLLPEGAALFEKGFKKRKLKDRNRDYFDRFVKETCRAEYVHWLTILFAPIFFLWNLVTVGVIMIAYAVIVNLPCILAQRYNRIRLNRIVQGMPSP